MSWLSRLLDSFRSEPRPDPLQPVLARVTPDPQYAAELERRRAELVYQPRNEFHRDLVQQRGAQ